jgi:hypothetical protein
MVGNKFQTFKQFTSNPLRKVSDTRLGSNEGGLYAASNGDRYYVKHYSNPDQAKAEVLAGKIYHHMGIHTVKPEYREVDGKPSVISRFDDNLTRMSPRHFESLSHEQAKQIGRMYHGAVLTKNWDIVGQEHDNILKHASTGNLHSIDAGGAFHFRAQGKTKEYGPDIDEHESLRSGNKQSSHVFNRVFASHPDAEKSGVDAVRGLDDEIIHREFQHSGLPNWKELHTNFQARKKSLLAKY